jgi:hypothetical protein
MPTDALHKSRRTYACAALLAVAAAAAVWVARTGDASPQIDVGSSSGVVACRIGQFRYEYHAPSGTESLFDLKADPNCLVNVMSAHSTTADECRLTLREHLGVADLSELRSNYTDSIRRLQALGYL